jgi:TatD DNase family protein
VAAVAAKVAELRGESLEAVAKCSTATASRLFNLPVDTVG